LVHIASIIHFVYGRGNIRMARLICISAIWDAIPCSLVHGRQCFEGTHFLCTEDRGSRFLHKWTQTQKCLENVY